MPSRDIILAMTADEEGGTSNGVDWLIKNRRDLIDAEFVLNHDGGGVLADHGKPVMMEVNATEKLYGDFVLTATNPGGHSSLPRPENAIYELADALTRIAHYQFPFELNNITRAYYERQVKMEAVARLSKDPLDNSTMHTTCVATRLSGGHANNALPQMAQANVNCRIEPGHTLEEIRMTLEKIVADPKVAHSTIKVQFRENSNVLLDHGSDRHSYVPPAPRKEVFDPLEKVVAKMWPGIPVLPNMSTGASDGVYTNAAGMPTYGVGGVQYDRDDIRAHGKDERDGVEAFARGVDFYYLFLKGVTTE
jgi:acetylornithine deacetylase/succinyl-diaminopimelate desuccinylase-like protein